MYRRKNSPGFDDVHGYWSVQHYMKHTGKSKPNFYALIKKGKLIKVYIPNYIKGEFIGYRKVYVEIENIKK